MDRKKIIEKLYRALAAEPFEYKGPPYSLEIQDLEGNPVVITNPLPKIICTGTTQNPDGTTTPYTISEKDIIEATFCGLTSECASALGRKSIIAVAFNRNKAFGKLVNRGNFSFSGVVAELVDSQSANRPLSCWNDADFEDCESLMRAVARNRAMCNSHDVIPALNHESVLEALEFLGFNGTRETSSPNYNPATDPTLVFVFGKPDDIARENSWHPCLTGMTTESFIVGYRRNLVHDEYMVILDENGNPTGNCRRWPGIKSAVISDGCHAFLSNSRGSTWMLREEIVKCPKLQPPIKPGERRGVCVSDQMSIHERPTLDEWIRD
jgi:hypothetical protein